MQKTTKQNHQNLKHCLGILFPSIHRPSSFLAKNSRLFFFQDSSQAFLGTLSLSQRFFRSLDVGGKPSIGKTNTHTQTHQRLVGNTIQDGLYQFLSVSRKNCSRNQELQDLTNMKVAATSMKVVKFHPQSCISKEPKSLRAQ